MSRLAAADLAAATNTSLYTVPANRRATVSVNLCNRTITAALVRLAITTGGTPADTDWIDYDVNLNGNSSYERSGIILSAGQILYARASAVGVTAVAWGVEEQV